MLKTVFFFHRACDVDNRLFFYDYYYYYYYYYYCHYYYYTYRANQQLLFNYLTYY